MKKAYGILIRDNHNKIRHVKELYATQCGARNRRDLELQIIVTTMSESDLSLNLEDDERATIDRFNIEVCAAKVVEFVVPSDLVCIL